MVAKMISRRRFLVGAGLGLGAATTALCGFSPLQADGPAANLPETSYGGSTTMEAPILVAYASRAGSTASIAEAIGQTLAGNGARVDVRPMAEITNLAPYRAVVAGSAIRGGKWLPEAMTFLETNRVVLGGKPFAAFLVCITMGSTNEQYRQGVRAWLEPVRRLVKPVGEGFFAGVLDFSTLPLNKDTLMLRAAVALGALPRGDKRDWEAVRAWAQRLAQTL